MAREKGLFQVSVNYEPLTAAPFDARMKVEARADLIKPETWQQKNGDIWIYNGMIVAVATDIEPSYNGLYILLDKANYTELSAWQKQATEADIASLQEQIDNIQPGEGGGGSDDIEVQTRADLPEIGNSDITYFIKDEQIIARWDDETQMYLDYGASVSDIEIIYGGNANEQND